MSRAKKKNITKKKPVSKTKTNKTIQHKHKKDSTNKNNSTTHSVKNKNNYFSLAILTILILVAIIFTYFMSSNNDNSIKLITIYDDECVNCQVDLFAEQVKNKWFPNMTVQKFELKSQKGQEIVKELNLKQVPVYLFSEEISYRDDWESILPSFVEINLSGKKYFMLKYDLIPYKIMTKEPELKDNAVILGDTNAPLTMFEFCDFEDSLCALAYGNDELVQNIKLTQEDYEAPMQKLYKDFVETGKVKIIFYNFPNKNKYPHSKDIHLATLCANEQNKWKEYSNTIWHKRSEWIDLDSSQRVFQFKEYAKNLNLIEAQFNNCFDSRKYDKQIEEETEIANNLGIDKTPFFSINRAVISGPQNYFVFENLIKEQLEG